jgi:glycosyltransferase involved in cell wall biosynthesis
MKEKTRLLILIDNLDGGGAQEIIYQLCKGLSRKGLDITVLSLHGHGIYKPNIESLGIRVEVLQEEAGVARIPVMLFRLVQIIDRRRFDIIHIFLSGAFLLAVPIAWAKRLPIVHSVLSVRRQPPGWYYPLLKVYEKFVTVFLALEEKELVEQAISADKIRLCEVLLDLEAAYAGYDARLDQAARAEDFVVISAGRLHPEKGHDLAIKAWPVVLERHPTAKLLIAGTGPDEARLSALINNLGLAQNIRLIGFRTDLERLFTDADLFLRTSLNEGTNLVTFLAMAFGLPIVACENTAPKDYVTHNYTGWVVPPDWRELGKAIVYLLESPEKRSKLGRTAHDAMRSYFDPARVMDFHERLYANVVDRQPCAMLPSMKNEMWPVCNPFVPPTEARKS